MKHPNIRIARLKEMIALEEKRASLQSHIAVVNERLSTIQNELYGAGAARNATAKEPLVPKQKALVKLHPKGQRKGRGELKGQILEMLNAAGNAGTSVKELADRIGIKTANIHSWFSANIKKLAGLKKVGAARYALNSTAVVSPKPAKKAKGAKKPKARKSVKAPKKAKAAKVVKKGKVVKAARGQLKEQILSALKAAGTEGITIKDLAAKLNAKYRNVYIWFVTTGKNIEGITKVGPAQYKMEAA